MPERFVSKIPEVTPTFWVAKVVAAPVGAIGAAALADRLGLTLSTALLVQVLLVALVAQFAGRRYAPARYWLIVLLTSGTGWLLSEYLTDDLGVSRWAALAGLAALLATTLTLWRLRQHTLSIHTIDTPGREAWYWLTVLWTFALGSAAAEVPGSGYLAPALIAVVAGARYLLTLDVVAAFWLAFLLTQPLGLTLGDLVARPRGLGLGPAVTGLAGLALLAGIAARRTVNRRDAPPSYLIRPDDSLGPDRSPRRDSALRTDSGLGPDRSPRRDNALRPDSGLGPDRSPRTDSGLRRDGGW